ncbi:hypothetical protein REPUB_Repub04eG0124900 [Reevesia pubescens]
MGGGKDKHEGESSDKGLFSSLAGYAAGHYAGGHYPPHGSYPPQGYPPHGYPPQGYSPAGYPPPWGYPPPGTIHMLNILLQEDILRLLIHLIADIHQLVTLSRPYGYSSHGHGVGGLIAGGAAAAAAVYGAHHMVHGAHHLAHGGYYGHGHGKFKHGKFKHRKFGKRWKHDMFGRHKGKFFGYKKWK